MISMKGMKMLHTQKVYIIRCNDLVKHINTQKVGCVK